ncbi:MAG: hypothetical protein WCP09_01055 [Candidatus Taylorbacteria bacterium]
MAKPTAATTTTPAAPAAATTKAVTPAMVIPPKQKMSKTQKWALLLAPLIILIIFVSRSSPSGSSGSGDGLNPKMSEMVKQSYTTAHESGVIIAVPGKWQGVSVFGRRVDMNILVDDVHWLVRFDHDDSRIFKLYPRNWREKSHLENTVGFNTIEVSIEPNQKLSQAPVAWAISETRDVPSS